MSREDTLLQRRKTGEEVAKKGSERDKESKNKWVILTTNDEPTSRSADKERERKTEGEQSNIHLKK